MKEFLITVNGKTYEVQVEEAGESPKASVPVKPAEKAEVKPEPKPAGTTGKTAVKCPMPGSIVKINVNIDDTIKTGAVLCILEAMKMENEIKSPKDGVIASINVSKGTSVNSGDVLFTIN